MWLYRVNEVVAPVVRLYWRLGLVGPVEAIPREGPILLVSNHASYLDPWFLGLPFPRAIRFLMVRKWYDRSRLWKEFFRAYGAVPVEGRSEATIDAVGHLLAKGEVVGVFPEGRISRDGRIRKFRPGVALMAARSGAPVLPVGIRGNFDSLPRQRRFPKPVKVAIHVGQPLVFPGAPSEVPPSSEEIQSFLERIFRDVCQLAGRAEGASKPEPPGQVDDF